MLLNSYYFYKIEIYYRVAIGDVNGANIGMELQCSLDLIMCLYMLAANVKVGKVVCSQKMLPLKQIILETSYAMKTSVANPHSIKNKRKLFRWYIFKKKYQNSKFTN